MIIKLNESLNTDTYDNDFYIESILTEGTKYDKKAITKLVDSRLFDEETSTNIVNALFRQDIHAFVHAPAWLEKYLVGIVNMLIKYCDGDASKAQEFFTNSIDVFEEYLTWVKDIRPTLPSNKQLELDRLFNEQMSIQDLEKELEAIRAQRDKESKEKLKYMQFEKTSSFELIPIDFYEQFNRMFGGRATGDGTSDKYAGRGGTAWCHANSKSTYNSWVKNGSCKFFVLANKNWKNISFDKESNNANPKDDYGNSLIAILVNIRIGRLLNATLRCNHVGVPSNADNQYKTYAELSSVVGFNVEDKVMEYLKDSLVDISNVENIFDGTSNSLTDYCNALGISNDALTEFTIPNGVISIGDWAFRGCSSLTSITIPNSITSIGDYAFSDCSSLKSVTIPNSVTSIGDDAFSGCSSLKSVTIPDSVKSIGSYAFEYCSSLTSVTIPNSVTSIGNWAFEDCSGLKSVTIPGSVTSIGHGAFQSCSSLKSVTIPNSVTSIGAGTFSYCSSLTSITMPNSVTGIGSRAFYGCSNLTIKCTKGSYAEHYATKNNIPIQLIESISTW